MNSRIWAQVLVLAAAALPCWAWAAPTLYTIGDSTVQNYAASYYPRSGWGQVLPAFFDAGKVVVTNKAVGGTSSMSYYNQHWPALRGSLKPGDVVMIQFGINDSKAYDPNRYTVPFGTFDAYLTLFVNETRAAGAHPILVTPVTMNSWSDAVPPTVLPVYQDYPVAARQLAAALGVPLIDLDQRGTALMQSVGPLYSTRFIYFNLSPGEFKNYPNGIADDVHFQEMGAIEMAQLVVEGVRNLSTDPNVGHLAAALRPTYPVTFTSNNTAAGVVTRSASFPAGLTVTAQALPHNGYVLLNWGGALSGSHATQSFTMGTAAKSISANFRAVSATDVYPAETATRSGTGMVVEASNTGFHGSGYINFPQTGGSLTFKQVSGGAGGSKTLRLRFALTGSSARSGQLVVNGVRRTLSFPATGGWTAWRNLDISATLKSGSTNTIEIRSTGSDLANVDEMLVL